MIAVIITAALHAMTITIGVFIFLRLWRRDPRASLADRPKLLFGASARRAVQAALYGKPTIDSAHHLQGGGSDSALAARAVSIADAIQRQLGEIVNKPGLKAIEAVLLMSMGAKKQKEVIAQVGTSKPSFQKYKPLVEQVLASCAVGATLTGAAALIGPTAAGLVGGSLAAAVLPLRITSLPNVSGARLAEELTTEGRTYRIWVASVRYGDGTLHECRTEPVLHEPPLPGETKDDCRRRETREHMRIVSALRALDPQALAAGRAKDRDRKRAKAVKRASELSALPSTSLEWLLPPSKQPHFVGEHVWHSTATGVAPTLAVIQELQRDGSARLVAETDGSTFESSPQDSMTRVGLTVPSYIGQRVEIDAGRRSRRDLAEITATRPDGTVDVRLFDPVEGSYDGGVRTCIHVEGVSVTTDDLAPRMALMRDVAMMLADDALVEAGYVTLDDLAEECEMEEEENPWYLAPIRWLPFVGTDGSHRPNGLQRIACEEVSDAMDDSRYVPPKLIDWGKPPSERTAEWPKPGQRPMLRDPQSPQLQRARDSSWGPLMSRHNTTPACRCNPPSLCTQINFGHFIACDHPPGRDGPHPYIVVPAAEDAGADMRQARELLGVLETAVGFGPNGDLLPPPDGIYYPVPESLEEWHAYIYSTTHQVPHELHSGDPAGPWAALQEARRSGRDLSAFEPAFDAMHQHLLCAAEANARIVAEMQRKSADPSTRFVRVAKRAIRRKEVRLRQTCIDWPAVRKTVASASGKTKVL